MAQLVDWELAERLGARLAPGGPEVSATEAAEAVAALRELSVVAREPVERITGLHADPVVAPAVVVDRPEWIRSNLAAFQVALDPFLISRAERTPAALDAVGSRLTAAQVGAALAWLSGRVLGQFEVITPPAQPGRLLLVAPNIVMTERDLDLEPADFRLWVCLHEETHRAQFGGVPWLRDHFLGEVSTYVAASDLPTSELVMRLVDALRALVSAARGQSGPSLIEAVQTPAQRLVFDRMTGLMSLLEGHADYVMDAVGPVLIPTVDVIRARFEVRRAHVGTVDGFARRVLGMQHKLKQYSSGAQFVRSVLAAEGEAGFAQVWVAPAHLPSAAEIERPLDWCRRVLG